MIRTLLILVAAIALAFFLDFGEVIDSPAVVLRVTDPAAMHNGDSLKAQIVPKGQSVALPLGGGRGLEVKIETKGWIYAGNLVVTGEGGPIYIEAWTRERLGTISRKCKVISESRWVCHIPIRTKRPDAEVRMIYPESGSAKISEVSFKAITAQRMPAVSSETVISFFLTLMVLGPLLRALNRKTVLEIGLSIIGSIFLYVSGATSLFIVLGLGIFGYVALRIIEAERDFQKKRLILFLFLIGLIVISAKVILPYAYPIALDPYSLVLPFALSYIAIRIADLLIAAAADIRQGLKPREYMAFIFFPAVLAAGPVVTLDQFRQGYIENWGATDVAAGIARFCIGFAKKSVADAIFIPVVTGGIDGILVTGTITPRDALYLLGANVCYVYLDFSAYTDMALGCGRTFGWLLPENFNWPLIRPGMRAFWRNWHMSLSHWAFRRVYFPVVLKTKSAAIAVFSTMLLIGLWHVPRITWVLWAAHHSFALVAEPFFVAQVGKRLIGNSTGLRADLFNWAGIILGVVFVWFWVSAGHAFTLFSDPTTALLVYGKLWIFLVGWL